EFFSISSGPSSTTLPQSRLPQVSYILRGIHVLILCGRR
ncbi:hypothetical protein AB1N83_013944, partial [Pleurotus pulmonarius]